MTKSDSEVSSQRQIVAAGKVLDLILSSTGPAVLCRQVVHSDFAPESTRSCELFYLDSKSLLRSVASYGTGAGQTKDLSAWDDSPLSEAIREKRLVTGPIVTDGMTLSVIAIPFVTNGVPVGLASVLVQEIDYKMQISTELEGLFAKLGAFYLESLDVGNMAQSTASLSVNPEALTARQMTILGHIDNGLVNIEIAQLLMLSESTIRQETVRIYRALGVGNRKEAAKKAKALGFLANRSLPLSN
jgi:DNA-binding CsgD family transcriptional regulator